MRTLSSNWSNCHFEWSTAIRRGRSVGYMPRVHCEQRAFLFFWGEGWDNMDGSGVGDRCLRVMVGIHMKCSSRCTPGWSEIGPVRMYARTSTNSCGSRSRKRYPSHARLGSHLGHYHTKIHCVNCWQVNQENSNKKGRV